MTTDDKIWEMFSKNIKPLKDKNEVGFEPSKLRELKPKRLDPLSAFATSIVPEKELVQMTKREMRRIEIDGRLDLHGMTQQEAHLVFSNTVARAWKNGKKTLLIITGKGSLENPETLRKMLPHWCAQNPLSQMIKSIAPAKPEHGGSGAYYFFLRANRG